MSDARERGDRVVAEPAGPELDEQDSSHDEAHTPSPTLWPLGFAIGIVVDAHVDPHDYAQVAFYAGANVDPARDVVLGEGPADHLDHATVRQFVGGKLGIDATAKWPEEGGRPWPPEIEMSDEVRELVTRRWDEYGIPADPAARKGSMRHSWRRLSRR